jgi:hypothetical protein
VEPKKSGRKIRIKWTIKRILFKNQLDTYLVNVGEIMIKETAMPSALLGQHTNWN